MRSFPSLVLVPMHAWVLLTYICMAACGGTDEGGNGAHEGPGGSGIAETAVGSADSEPEPMELDGSKLFLMNCAICHGATGDGKGVVLYDPPARSFIDGGFSFGNTPEALLRTISNGIGGTPMPGFGEVLSEGQLAAIVDHVISLGPPRDEVAKPGDTIFAVKDRARVIRGGLPPIVEGVPGQARGMLVGNADGLTLEYATSPLRLLGVRQGLFANRKDWQSRGGDVVEPLGQLLYAFEKGQAQFDWCLGMGKDVPNMAVISPTAQELTATVTVGGTVFVESILKFAPSNSAGITRLTESAGVVEMAGLMGFRRTFEFDPWPSKDELDDSFSRFVLVEDHDWKGTTWKSSDQKITVREVGRSDGRNLVRLSHAPVRLANGATQVEEDWLFVVGDWDEAMQKLKEELQ